MSGEWCQRCSNNKPCTKVKWYDRNGGCDDDWYNQRSEWADDSCGGCPLDDYTGKCQCNGTYIEKEVAHYACNNGSCKSGTEWLPTVNCTTSHIDYGWGDPYCKNSDVYHSKNVYVDKCKSTSSTNCYCSSSPVKQEELIQDCPSDAPCCVKDGVAQCCGSPDRPSCSVTATADPNPIPCGQNQTTISPSGSGYTSCTGTGTFTQASQTTYTVYCTGDANHNDCSSKVTVSNSACKYDCDVNGNCVVKSDGKYTTSNCDNKCSSLTHLACDTNKQCVSTLGAGVDLCANS
ncbi:hypothetical protein GW879_01830, partial [Candidatus Kaiserbacteria bacterium]|nr:hypothetical protein [Candidatus Kaiserbacteria bacterium]